MTVFLLLQLSLIYESCPLNVAPNHKNALKHAEYSRCADVNTVPVNSETDIEITYDRSDPSWCERSGAT